MILATARELLAKLRRARRVPARLIGVALSGLDERDSDAQLGLFDDGHSQDVIADSSRDRAVSRVIDAVRERFGQDAVMPGRLAQPAVRERRRS